MTQPKLTFDESKLKVEYYSDFILFCKDLLKFHGEMIYDFGFFHKEIADAIIRNRYVAIMVPRGHLKTTIVSVCYPIWRMVREKRYEIVLTSSTMEQSVKNLGTIKYYLENTPWLDYLIPSNKDGMWNH